MLESQKNQTKIFLKKNEFVRKNEINAVFVSKTVYKVWFLTFLDFDFL